MTEHISDKRRYFDIYGVDLHPAKYQLYPKKPDTEQVLYEYFKDLKEHGMHTTLVDGAFDVPHANHEAYLRHCRLVGAEAYARSITNDTPSDYQLRRILTSDNIHLTVTVDADEKIAQKKSGLAHKGGVERPIYPWQARADRVAGYAFELNGTFHRTVDLVTVEGDAEHIDTPLESSLTLADFLAKKGLLDTFVVFGEHESTVAEADELPVNTVVLPEENIYFINPQTGKGYSSSKLIHRAQGQAVKHPITSPLQEAV